jgi:hypothetical protein
MEDLKIRSAKMMRRCVPTKRYTNDLRRVDISPDETLQGEQYPREIAGN